MMSSYLVGGTKYSWQRAPSGGGRNVLLAGTWLVSRVLRPVLTGLYIYRLSYPRSRWTYYMSTEKDSVLGVHRTRRGWSIADHTTEKPGSNQGALLRAALIPALTEEADRNQIVVRAIAASRKQAESYMNEIPGMECRGLGSLGGYRLVREPQQKPKP